MRQSIIAPYIDGLLAEKRANGRKYESEELILNRFDNYCIERNLDTLNITKEFLCNWMEKKDNEGEFYKGKRISVVKQVLLYMSTCGIKVYLPSNYCHAVKPLPHIFTKEEKLNFFNVVDTYQPKSSSSFSLRMRNEYSLLFRWYACLGLRNSEAAGIKTENVDLKSGVLTILDSKGNKDRLVYLCDDLLISTRNYYKYIVEYLGFHPIYFFPGRDVSNPIPNTSVDTVFNKYWGLTEYKDSNNKPTVHDFRFTFVVERLNTWSSNDEDINVMLPYLSKHLGHKSIKETFYYYYLVEDAFKTIKKKDTHSCVVIPEVKEYE